MRALRLGGFGLVGGLIWVVVSHLFSVDRQAKASPAESSEQLTPSLSSPPPAVPPPPVDAKATAPNADKSVPGSDKTVPPPPGTARPVARPSRRAAAALVPIPEAEANSKPVIRDLDTGEIISPKPVANKSQAPAAQPEAPPAEVAKGPVIVVPHERDKDENHPGWVKSVGKKLGIGKPDPLSHAFE